MEEDENIKLMSEETAKELTQRFLALANEKPFVEEALKRYTLELYSLIWRNLELSHFDAMIKYYMCKFKYLLSKWPFRRYRLLRARKALIRYRDAFHASENFKREFHYEKTE